MADRTDLRALGRGVVLGLALAAGTMVSACAEGTAPLPDKEDALAQNPTPDIPDGVVTITGIRLTRGNAVDCPQIRDDAGAIHPVSYLSPAIEIGARVVVSGHYGVSTRCNGTVLVVETEGPGG